MVRRIRSPISPTSRLTLVGFGSSVCRREKASNRWVRGGGPVGGPLRGHDVAVQFLEPALLDARVQELEAPRDAGQQVVEIVARCLP